MVDEFIRGFSNDTFVFGERIYLIQLDPVNAPNMYKLGFASNLRTRFLGIKTTNGRTTTLYWFCRKLRHVRFTSLLQNSAILSLHSFPFVIL